MKILLASTIIILLCILCGIYLFSYILDTSTIYINEIAKIRDEITNENWLIASSNFEALEKKWDKTEKFWKIVVEHEELDTVSLYFSSIKDYIDENEKPHALAELSILEYFITHIMEKERLTIQNIF